ncbi:hypothetical protein C8R46DRAFT_1104571 [Mycena filopes]|nr:hypothetical protein C8R46DRAFT_1104571 [Mycena filopes]
MSFLQKSQNTQDTRPSGSAAGILHLALGGDVSRGSLAKTAPVVCIAPQFRVAAGGQPGGDRDATTAAVSPHAVERRCVTPAHAVGAAGGRARSGASAAPRALDALAPPKSVGPVSDCTRTSAIKLDEGVEPTCSIHDDGLLGFLLVLAALALSLAWLALCSSLGAPHAGLVRRPDGARNNRPLRARPCAFGCGLPGAPVKQVPARSPQDLPHSRCARTLRLNFSRRPCDST